MRVDLDGNPVRDLIEEVVDDDDHIILEKDSTEFSIYARDGGCIIVDFKGLHTLKKALKVAEDLGWLGGEGV